MKGRTYRGLLMVTALAAAVAIFVSACGGDSGAASGDTVGSDALQSGSIVVSGLVDYPMTFTAVDMDYMDWITATVEDPTSGSVSYDGVSLTDIWTFFGVQSDAKTVVITGVDGTKSEVALSDIGSDAFLAVGDDNSLNMVMPGLDAQAWVKDVVAMEFE